MQLQIPPISSAEQEFPISCLLLTREKEIFQGPNFPGNSCCPELCRRLGLLYLFVHSNGQCPCSASRQLGKDYSQNLLFISALHPFKIRGRFLFCKDQVRTQSDSGGWLGQSSRPPEWFSWCISGTSHISLIPLIAAGTSRATWQLTGDELGGQIQHMGFPGTAWIGGIHPSAALTTPNRQPHNIPIVQPGEKTTSERPQKE